MAPKLIIVETPRPQNVSILLKKVLHHLFFTNFLRNVLNKYMKHIFLILYCRGGLDTLSDTTINLCRNILLKSVKMHFSGNTKILGF